MPTEPIFNSPPDECLRLLHTSRGGLSTQEAWRRLEHYGPNEVARKKKEHAVIGFLRRFQNPLVIILLIASILTLFLGEFVNAIIIISMIVLSVCIDFFQESKAEKAVELLKERITLSASVMRDGDQQEIKITELVPGDIISLNPGDIVPADACILSAKDFFVNQSALTGEPFPVEKTPAAPGDQSSPQPSRSSYVFLGTSVVSGNALAVVAKTGMATEYGHIARELMERPPETEFERGLRHFGFLIMEIIFFLVLFVFSINALFRHGILESLLFSVALAVGLTPELLPMILTVNLSKGAMSMSEKGLLVKHLASIQNFGSMDVLCTDKTGTLTENTIRLLSHIDAYGKINEMVFLFSYLNSYHQTGLKTPLDTAILEHQPVPVEEYRKVDEIPFDFGRRRVSVVVDHAQERLLISKGAPEEILKVCSSVIINNRIEPLSEIWMSKINKQYEALSAEGFRTLGVSYRPLTEIKSIYSTSEEKEMVFLGFVTFLDPPKETARESLQLLKKAGVDLKIVTGDNELVTKKVCEALEFDVQMIITGNDLAVMPDDALARVVEQANIFARINPAQKDRIIKALMKNGHVVGFLGDGINDAPSLRTADVGISVDNAVDIAKESADLILLKKDLHILKDGVLEGRKTFGNTMKYIMMGTSSNFGNMFSVAGASLFLTFLPMLPVQILLNNFLYDLSQSTIPTDSVDQEYLQTPKRWDIGFIKRFIIFFGPISSLFDFVTFFILLAVFMATEPVFQTAWFIESLSTQTLIIFVIRTRIVPFYLSRPSVPLLIGGIGVVTAGILIPFTILGSLFGFVHPPLLFLGILAILVTGYLILVELLKHWFYQKYSFSIEGKTVSYS